MPNDLDQLRERARQNRTALSDGLVGSTPNTTTATGRVASTPVAGSRVLDRVTGEEGELLTTPTAGAAGTGKLLVQLRTGGVVLRDLGQLVARPALPGRTQ